MELVREEPLLPLDPASAGTVCMDVDTPILCPSCHCLFKDCTECGLIRYQKEHNGSHEARLHISNHRITFGTHGCIYGVAS